MDETSWSDIYGNAEHLAAALDLMAARIAKKTGNYDSAADVRYGAECIRDLSARLRLGEALALQAQTIEHIIAEKARLALAIVESLSKPS